jgi:hypothetical protein
VLAGQSNTSSGKYSGVVTVASNLKLVSGNYSGVLSGYKNKASGFLSGVVTGYLNIASGVGDSSRVVAGGDNTAIIVEWY